MSTVWTNITEKYSQRCVPPADTNKHSPVYYCVLIPRLFAYRISEAVTSASPRDHSEIMQPPSPAPAPRQLLLSSLQSVCKSLCEFNLPPDFMVLPNSFRLPGLEMPEANIWNTGVLVHGLKLQFKFGNEWKSNCHGILIPPKWFSEE